MNKLIYISFLVIVFFACKRNEEEFETGSEYYPIRDSGSFIIYDVQQINYNPSGSDTLNFQLKEMMGDTISLNGLRAYKVLRYTRPNASAAWPSQPDSVWYTYKNVSTAVKSENNIKFIKMVFPVENGTTWNANALNNMGAENYTIQKLKYPYTVNSHYFPNTVTVLQRFDTSAIGQFIDFEVYSKGIGLIHKSVKNVDLCQSGSCISQHILLNKDSIVGGVKYEQRFNSYQ
jgi:hypothetical protein